MRLSKYFIPMLKETPSDATIVSHRLMLRSGMIRQLTSGIYSWLPIGQKVLDKISKIVEKGMDKIGAMKMTMPLMQPSHLWAKSGRYGDGSDLSTETLVAMDRNKKELLFAPTAEEVVTDIVENSIQSYKNFPLSVYQIHWKFRDEIRPRFGVLRCREFLMKDAYSFDITEEDALNRYDDMFHAYLDIYSNMGLKTIPVKADSGSIGGNHSHEFHVLANTGESTIFFDDRFLNDEYLAHNNIKDLYAREEIKHNPTEAPKNIIQNKSIEIGHIFYLGDKYTKDMNVSVQNKNGELIHPKMGCYGIGISRLAGAIIEANHDDKGIKWPKAISPFDGILINLSKKTECIQKADHIYEMLSKSGVDILYDDTKDSVGVKLSRAELLGVPVQIIVNDKSVHTENIEIRYRNNLNNNAYCNISQINEIFSNA